MGKLQSAFSAQLTPSPISILPKLPGSSAAVAPSAITTAFSKPKMGSKFMSFGLELTNAETNSVFLLGKCRIVHQQDGITRFPDCARRKRRKYSVP